MINIKNNKLGKSYNEIDLFKSIEEDKFNVGINFIMNN